MPRFFFLLLFPVAGFAAASPNDLEFNGVVVTASAEGEKTSVSLLNTATGTSKWVAIGGKFDGLVVTAYRPGNPAATPPTSDTVILAREGTGAARTLTITLKNSVILPANGSTVARAVSVNAEQKAALVALIERQSASLNSLNEQLAQARSDPDADPRQIQAMEAMQAGIQRQQQQLAAGNTAVIEAVMASAALSNGAVVKPDGAPSKDVNGKVMQANPAAPVAP
jgi:hypothetical protein